MGTIPWMRSIFFANWQRRANRQNSTRCASVRERLKQWFARPKHMANRERRDRFPRRTTRSRRGDLETSEPLLAELSIGAILWPPQHRGGDSSVLWQIGGQSLDSPDRSYGVLYAGLDEYCSFIETYGQTTGIRTVTSTALEGRHLAHLELLRPMKLIDLSNSGGLARVGADSRLFGALSRCRATMVGCFSQTSHQTRRHPLPARHDAARNACAIYECLPSVFKPHAEGSLLEHQHLALLGTILDCYGFAIIP